MARADLLVLGGGVAGHACARASAECGARVILVDGGDWRHSRSFRSALPQALLASLIRKAPATATGATLYQQFLEQRDVLIEAEITAQQRTLTNLGVAIVRSRGTLDAVTPHAVVRTQQGCVEADRLVLAVGARIGYPDWAGPGTPVVPTDDVYLRDGPLPSTLAILGADYIGVAEALLFRALGTDVVLIFDEDEPLVGQDAGFRSFVGDALAARGIRLRPGTTVNAVTSGDRRHALDTSAGVIPADLIALAASGKPLPNTTALALERFDIACTNTGGIFVDVRYQTNVHGVFAIGDCADHAGQGLHQTAYDLSPVAEEEGRAVAANLFGAGAEPIDYDLVPLAIDGPLPFGALGLGSDRARALGFDVLSLGGTLTPATSFAQLVVDGETGQVLGCQLAGPGADGAIRRAANLLRRTRAPARLAEALSSHANGASAVVQELVAQARSLG